MKKQLLILVCLLLSALPASAQDTTPPQVREAALNGAAEVLGSRAINWRFEILNETTSSNLGCPLVAGSDMGVTVTPYRVFLTYPDNQEYVVHVSADGARVVLCDQKFGNVGQPASQPTVAATGECEVVMLMETTLYTTPDFNSAAVEALQPNVSVQAIGQTQGATWLQVITPGGGIAWVYATNINTSGNCLALPVTAARDASAVTTACFAEPAGAFSNVRSRPSVEANQVDTIYENSSWQVSARNTDGTWFFINPGWVASSVLTLTGDCTGVPVDENLVGGGSTPGGVSGDETTVTTDVTTILNNYRCPANSSTFMPPRISIGAGTAQIEQGGVPNRVRAFPSTNPAVGEQVGVVQPGRTIDRVINGPVCNEVYVWWYVEIDGIQGWTVESDAEAQTYFLAPTGAAATPVQPPANPTQTSAGTGTVSDIPVIELTSADGNNDVAFSPDGVYLLIVGRGATATEIVVIDTATNQPLAELLTADDAIINVDFTDNTTAGAMTTAGDVVFWNVETGQRLRTFEDVNPLTPNPIQFSEDGALFVTGSCAEANPGGCATGQVALWDAVTGNPIRQQPAHPEAPAYVVFSADQERIASAARDGIQIWDLQSGAFVTAFAAENELNATEIVFAPDHSVIYRGFCADRAETGECTSGEVVAYSLETGAEVTRYAEHTDLIIGLALSTDGRYLASAGADGRVIVMDTTTNERVLVLENAERLLVSVAFNVDTTALAAAGEDGVFIWDVSGVLEPAQTPDDEGGIG